VSVAAADQDTLFTTEARHAAEGVLLATGEKYQVSLYSGTQHGFGVRVSLSDESQKWAKEQAFLQAVRWFDRFFVTD
jgi:dienelactone hydrolase